MQIVKRAFIPALLVVAAPALLAQQKSPATAGGKFPLTVDSIMRGPDLVGYPPDGLRWSADSEKLYFEWRKPGEDDASTYVIGRAGGTPKKLSDEERRSAVPVNGRWDDAHTRVLFVDRGDVVMLDQTGKRHQLTRIGGTGGGGRGGRGGGGGGGAAGGGAGNPRWVRHDSAVSFVREGNLYVVPVNGGEVPDIEQLTDNAPRRQEPRLTDSQKFLRDQEAHLFESVREAEQRRKKAEERDQAYKRPGIELQDRQTPIDLMLSPDETHVFVVVAESTPGARNSVVPSWVNETGYVEDIPARTDVGDVQGRNLLAVLNLKTDKTVWADGSFAPPVAEPETPGTEDKTDASDRSDRADGPQRPQREGPPQGGQGGRPGRRAEREIRWSMPDVSSDGTYAVAGARSTDNKDRWFVVVDPETGKTRVVDALHDDAWIREAGGGGFGAPGIDFLPDNRRVFFLSEKDGWMHLYTLDVSDPNAKPKQLTSGTWEITNAALSHDGKKFYITSTEVHPGERHIYSVSVDGGARTKLTSMTGSNEGPVSPDDSTVGVVYSYSNKPPELYLMPNTPGAPAKQITTSPTAEWRSFTWIDPKVITFKARDGVDVYARLFTPEMIGATRDPLHPGVVFVHGAGYAQNAHKYWASYFREYMFHNLLASRGYVVLDVDYRASSGYGRDWRTAIYRHMGGKDLDDIVDGAKYIAATQQVDARRIGVYGGSYGGFITLMAMFTTPDVFAAGAALRPVTDWAHYNHGYTSNILNVPQKDAEAYRQSSPIYFAEGLKGALLICHGMVDTNVLFQDSVRLVERLIELHKENWTFAPYPVENHGFERASSWADEYKRILKLFEENLRSAHRT